MVRSTDFAWQSAARYLWGVAGSDTVQRIAYTTEAADKWVVTELDHCDRSLPLNLCCCFSIPAATIQLRLSYRSDWLADQQHHSDATSLWCGWVKSCLTRLYRTWIDTSLLNTALPLLLQLRFMFVVPVYAHWPFVNTLSHTRMVLRTTAKAYGKV